MEAETKNQKEFVHPDGGYGWVIVFAIILINSSLLSLVQCFGIIFHDEFSAMGITAAETSFLLHLHSALYCSFGFFCSPLLKKFNYRLVAFVGATLMCLGIFLSSFANSYGSLIFSVSVLIGLGQGILMPATYLATYSYFKQRLTIAVSISVTGANLISIAMPKICDILLTNFGRTYTVLTLSAISSASLVGCFLLKPIQKPEKEGRSLEVIKSEEDSKDAEEEACGKLIPPKSNVVYRATTVPLKKENAWTKIRDIFDLQLLKDLPFVFVIVGLSISFAAENNIIFMLQFILQQLCKMSRSDVAIVASVQSVADIIGRLVVPFFSHMLDVPPKLMYASALVVGTLGRTVLAIWSQSKFTIYVACILIGLAKGTRAVYQSVIIPKVVSLEKIPAATGLNMLLTGALSLMVGPLIGAIRDQTNTYVHALHAASALSMFCVILWVAEIIFFRIRTKQRTDTK